MFKKIIHNRTIEEYNKKYGKISKVGKLPIFNESEIKNFNNKYQFVLKNEDDERITQLLKKDRTYWKIKNKYYPVPSLSEKIILGFKVSKPSTKVIICVASVAVIATAVVTPLAIMFTRDNSFVVDLNSNDTFDLSNKIAKPNQDYKSNIILKGDSDNCPDNLYVVANGKTLKANVDYKYEDKGSYGTIIIYGDNVKNKISIKGEAKCSGFAITPWSSIIKTLNDEGLKGLKKRFHVKTFVGKTHYIELKNTPLTEVVVIGENQDSIYNSGFKKSAALTFAFNDVTTGGSDLFKTSYNSSSFAGQYTYFNSALRRKCNDIFNDIVNEDLKENIKVVNKSTAYDYEGATVHGDYEITGEQVFALSLKELGGFNYTTKVDYDEILGGTNLIDKIDTELSVESENNAYTYFNHLYGRSIDDKFYKTLNKYNENIWTRTPSLNGDKAFGYDLENECFFDDDIGNVKYFIPAFALGEETSFESDSWDNLIGYANEGFDRLKEVYNLDSFIGLEKKILLDNEVYRARVIGENHDYTADGKTTALTFEFTRPVDGLASHLSKTPISSSNPSWDTSGARLALNDVTDENSLINRLPKVVKNNLKEVEKSSAIYYEQSSHASSGVVKTNDKVFILSRKEIGAKDAQKTKNRLESDEYIELIKDPYDVEGDTYEYYNNEYFKYSTNNFENADHARDKAYRYNSDHKTCSNSRTYLLRSANPKNEQYAQYIGSDGNVIKESWSTEDATLMPCFCIGIGGNDSTFENDSWNNLVNYINAGEEALTKAYNLKLEEFVGKQKNITITKKDESKERYRVRVIGTKHDTLASDSNKQALLTFEFTRCIENETRYSEEGNNIWSSSTLRYLCNNEFINYLPNEVKNSIKPVVKSTFRADTLHSEKTVDKMFALSTVEIGGNIEPLYDKFDGNKYDYYSRITDTAVLNAERIKSGGYFNNYHLRTPSLSSKFIKLAYYINESGNVNNSDHAASYKGIAPAFAI